MATQQYIKQLFESLRLVLAKLADAEPEEAIMTDAISRIAESVVLDLNRIADAAEHLARTESDRFEHERKS